jgi:hypothetical protein
MLVEGVLVHLTAIRTTQHRAAALHTVAAARLTAGKADLTAKTTANMLAAITSNFSCGIKAAERTSSAALYLAWIFAKALSQQYLWKMSISTQTLFIPSRSFDADVQHVAFQSSQLEMVQRWRVIEG